MKSRLNIIIYLYLNDRIYLYLYDIMNVPWTTSVEKDKRPPIQFLVQQGSRFDTRSWFIPCLAVAEMEDYLTFPKFWQSVLEQT
jgi:hypothetical protein